MSTAVVVTTPWRRQKQTRRRRHQRNARPSIRKQRLKSPKIANLTRLPATLLQFFRLQPAGKNPPCLAENRSSAPFLLAKSLRIPRAQTLLTLCFPKMGLRDRFHSGGDSHNEEDRRSFDRYPAGRRRFADFSARQRQR